MAMALSIGSSLSVKWDYDSYEPGEVTGRVLGWIARERSVPDCVVELDHALSTFGYDAPDVARPYSGSYLVMSTRYVDQSWAEDEGTVHVRLCGANPMLTDVNRAPSGPQIASHGVYRRIDWSR